MRPLNSIRRHAVEPVNVFELHGLCLPLDVYGRVHVTIESLPHKLPYGVDEARCMREIGETLLGRRWSLHPAATRHGVRSCDRCSGTFASRARMRPGA